MDWATPRARHVVRWADPGAAVLSFGFSKGVWMALIAPVAVELAKLRRTDVRGNEKRWMLRGYLAANPGANFEAIRGDLDLATGTLAYHLWVLETDGVIRSWRDGRLRRFALSGHRAAEDRPRLTDIELLLLQSLLRSPEITQRELAVEAGVSQPAVSYHMNRMAQMGVLRMEGEGFRRRYSVTLDDVPRDKAAGDDRHIRGNEPA